MQSVEHVSPSAAPHSSTQRLRGSVPPPPPPGVHWGEVPGEQCRESILQAQTEASLCIFTVIIVIDYVHVIVDVIIVLIVVGISGIIIIYAILRCRPNSNRVCHCCHCEAEIIGVCSALKLKLHPGAFCPVVCCARTPGSTRCLRTARNSARNTRRVSAGSGLNCSLCRNTGAAFLHSH